MISERQELSYRESKPDAQAKDPLWSVLRLRVRLQWGSFFMPLARLPRVSASLAAAEGVRRAGHVPRRRGRVV